MVIKTNRTRGRESSPSEAPSGALRWSIEQRLGFIEGRLFWLGAVNRTDLVRRFGVSMSQASGDIARYLALDPPGLGYDKSAKRYVAGDDFKPVLAAPRHGCLNLHASALPRWRGAAPIQRAIMAGDTVTAATVMRMDEGLDTGPVCCAEAVPIESDMTAGELHDLLATKGIPTRWGVVFACIATGVVFYALKPHVFSNFNTWKGILDQAAIRIVRLAAPFDRFPDNIRSDTDILHITRTWTFTRADQVLAE